MKTCAVYVGCKYFYSCFSFLLIAVEFCTCMLKGLMLHLCCQSAWGRSNLTGLTSDTLKMSQMIVIKPGTYTFLCFLFFFTRGEHCGGCRRSNSTERPHAFQVILTERPPLELSASDEQDMAEWMQLLCQSVSKGVRAVLSRWRIPALCKQSLTCSNFSCRSSPRVSPPRLVSHVAWW